MFLSFCFSSSKHNIILLLKYICVESISIKLPWKNKSKTSKNTKNILVFEKVTQLVARALVAVRQKKKLVKVKSQHWRILIIWKRSNKIKAVKTGVTLKVLCHSQSQISELLRSALKILSVWNRFWIMLCLYVFCDSKKIGHQAYKDIF